MAIARRVSLLVVLLGSALGAPSFAQGLPDRFSGTVIPYAGSAAIDEATALVLNPAGLAWVNGLELQSGLHLDVGANNQVDSAGDATAVVGGDFGGIGGGIGLVVPTAASPRLRGSLGAGVALDRGFAVGAALHGQRDLGAGGSDMGVDVGIQLRPASFLALGLVGEGLGERSGGTIKGGFALRPIDALTVGVDARLLADNAGLGASLTAGKVQPALSARLALGGVVVGAGVVVDNLGAVSAAPVSLQAQASVQANLDTIGATLLGGARDLGGTGTAAQVGLRSRLSSTAWESLLPPAGRWLSLRLTGEGVPVADDDGPMSFFADAPDPTWVLAALDDVADDASVDGLVVRFEGLGLGFARATELRQALARVKASGKKVVVHLDSGGDLEAYVASAADEVWLTPTGGIALDGLRAQMVYVASTLDRLGIKAEAISAGKYKSAPRMFTHDEPSPEELEVENALLDGAWATLTTAISDGRGIPVDEVKAIIDLGGLTGKEALDKKIVDALCYPDEIPERAAALAGRGGETVFLEGGWLDRAPRDTRWDTPPVIAIVPVIGSISMGRASGGLFGGGGAGSDDVVDAIEAAVKDDNVRAIVLRVDSPGGDALASDIMWRAVMRARQKKPVIASMGDVAASGGYYVASAADTIFVEDDTITGSIGVFGLMFSAEGLAADWGVRTHEVARGARPGPDMLRSITPAERERMQVMVDDTYETFLDAIVTGRTPKLVDADVTLDPMAPKPRITKDELRVVAEGRVWTGAQALERKLVDRRGSVVDAIKAARAAARISAESDIGLAVFAANDAFSLGGFGGLAARVLGVDDHAAALAAVRAVVGDVDAAAAAVDAAGKPLVLAPRIELR